MLPVDLIDPQSPDGARAIIAKPPRRAAHKRPLESDSKLCAQSFGSPFFVEKLALHDSARPTHMNAVGGSYPKVADGISPYR